LKRAKTTDKLTAYGLKLQKQLQAVAGKPHVKMGFPEEEFAEDHRDSGLTVGEIAVVHEFGSEQAGIPERSFIRSTYDEKQKEWRTLTEHLKKQVIAGKMTVKQALEQIGMRQVSDVRLKVRDHIPPPNKADTVARKGSSTPLIDQGQMINETLTHKVDMGGGGKKIKLGSSK
jgi:hypothetical protein